MSSWPRSPAAPGRAGRWGTRPSAAASRRGGGRGSRRAGLGPRSPEGVPGHRLGGRVHEGGAALGVHQEDGGGGVLGDRPGEPACRRAASSARLRSSMSSVVPYQRTMAPRSSRRGKARDRIQRFSPRPAGCGARCRRARPCGRSGSMPRPSGAGRPGGAAATSRPRGPPPVSGRSWPASGPRSRSSGRPGRRPRAAAGSARRRAGRGPRSPPAPLHPPAFGHVPEDQDDADDGPRRRGSGRRCRRSAARSRPWRSGGCGWPGRRPCPRSTRATGFSTGRRVSSLTMRKTSSSGRPAASPARQPVSASATGFRKPTRPSASVAITASPMLASVTRSRSSLLGGLGGVRPRPAAVRPAAPRTAGRWSRQRRSRGRGRRDSAARGDQAATGRDEEVCRQRAEGQGRQGGAEAAVAGRRPGWRRSR